MSQSNKFVIISTPRAGSTLLISYLERHPDCSCLCDIMTGIDKTILHDMIYRYAEQDIANPFKNVVRVMQTAHRFVDGFRFMMDNNLIENDNVCEYISKNKIIICFRFNILRQVLSLKLAENHGQWVNLKNKTIENRLNIEPKHIVERMIHIDSLTQRMLENFPKALLMPYEFFEYEKVLGFVGLRTTDLCTHLRPVNGDRKISDMVTNFDDLKSAVLTSFPTKEHWFNE